MEKYLGLNKDYYENGYAAEGENVESHVFRPYGRIFKFEFGLSGQKGEKLLDFGCGAGGSARFFKSKGFDVYGVDMVQKVIHRCQEVMPDIKDHFMTISPKPAESDSFFGGDFDLVTAIQSLYFYSDTDLRTRLISLYSQMKPGAILYATMMGSQNYYFKHTQAAEDGLRRMELNGPRLKIKDYYLNFTHSEQHLMEKFSPFEKIHIGHYDAVYSENEGSNFHYTYIGRKPRP